MLRNVKGDDGIIIHHYESSKKQMDYDFIAETDLFDGISGDGIRQIINCSGAFLKEYKKGQVVFREDEKPEYLFILMKNYRLKIW